MLHVLIVSNYKTYVELIWMYNGIFRNIYYNTEKFVRALTVDLEFFFDFVFLWYSQH